MPAWKIEPIFGGKLFRGQRRLAQIGAASRTDPRKTAIGDREGSRSASRRPRAYLVPFRELALAPAIIRNALKLTGLYWRARRNAEHVTVRRNDLRFAALPSLFDGYTILHISDMHVDMSEAAMQHLIELVDGMQYDLCVLTGDYRGRTLDRSRQLSRAWQRCERI